MHDPSNNRGITLNNILAKLCSLLLRKRINKWCESENVYNDAQFGFRDNRCTTDAIFLSHAIIHFYFQTQDYGVFLSTTKRLLTPLTAMPFG